MGNTDDRRGSGTSGVTRRPRGGVLPAALILIPILLLAAAPAGAQSFFRPLTQFRVIATERFDIVFPPESEESARWLASRVEGIYAEMSALLGIDVPFRIPVVLNPHTDRFNGFYASVPTPHIVLFEARLDPEWTTFPDALLYLFVHELAHFISLNSRAPGFDRLRRVFGSWVSPVFLNAPLFMIEGVAVSLESLSGAGRVNDPLVRQNLRQAIIEGAFPTPMQAAGFLDTPVQGGVLFYEYGGLFSAWLKETRGAETYARLWREMGRLAPFTFSVYNSGFYRIFAEVYGMDVREAWAEFRDSLALDGIEENPGEVLPRRLRFFSERGSFITRIAAAGDALFVLDGRGGRVNIVDAATGRTRSVGTGVMGANDIGASPDGSTVLVSASGTSATGPRRSRSSFAPTAGAPGGRSAGCTGPGTSATARSWGWEPTGACRWSWSRPPGARAASSCAGAKACCSRARSPCQTAGSPLPFPAPARGSSGCSTPRAEAFPAWRPSAARIRGGT